MLRTSKPRLVVVGVVIAFLAMLFTAPPALDSAQKLGWWPFREDYSSSTGEPSLSVGTYKQLETASEEPGENDDQVVTGCYVDGEVVPCHVAHDQEIYSPMSAGGCDEGSLILYLDGDPEFDVLGEELLVAEFERDPALCSVTSGGDLIDGLLKGVWSTDEDGNGYPYGGRYRRCHVSAATRVLR